MRNGFFNVQNGFFAQILGAQIAQILTQTFGAQIFRRFGAWKIGIPESRKKCAENLRKNLRRPNGPARGGGGPFHLLFLEQTARHTIAARPTYSRRACEGPS